MEVCKGHVHKGIKVLMSRTHRLQVAEKGEEGSGEVSCDGTESGNDSKAAHGCVGQ
jgi:hypothetical protein